MRGSVPDARTSTRPLPFSSALSRSASASAACGTSRRETRTFSFAWAYRGITAAASAQRAPADGVAEKERRREPVAGDVVAQADHVARLLSAEDPVLAP